MARGYNIKFVDSAVQFLSRTWTQVDAADHLLSFREPSYNAFTIEEKMLSSGHEVDTSNARGHTEQNGSSQDENARSTQSETAKILSLVASTLK